MTRSAPRGGDRAHDRPLAAVAVAAAAEDDDEPACDEGPQRRERLLQRVGLVGVIDEHRRAGLVADALEPARRAFEPLQRGEDGVGVASRREAEPGGDERVGDLEIAGQRQAQR